ncbi:hypothetical protein [Actinokineospora sp. UTMC 2448]|uniref:hypothetical protein n=1 Tax=Actinokineospora sp. UTMC 2448 TaxID=2268449 RepID=UPI002164BCA2|nr:hypothetical protein [Actinokineospora sp. UTMC 2448]
MHQLQTTIEQLRDEVSRAISNLERASASASQSLYRAQSDLTEEVTAFTTAASEVRHANAAGPATVKRSNRDEKWTYFKYGLITAVAIGAAICILVLVLINRNAAENSQSAPALTTPMMSGQVVHEPSDTTD